MIVIDSNVWISAVVFGGKPQQVFELVMRQAIPLVVSEEILSEVRRKLHQKFPQYVADFDSLLAVMAPRIRLVKLGRHTVTICRDPKDNMVIETAMACGAQVVVSGDKDLLTLKEYEAIKFVQPAVYLRED